MDVDLKYTQRCVLPRRAPSRQTDVDSWTIVLGLTSSQLHSALNLAECVAQKCTHRVCHTHAHTLTCTHAHTAAGTHCSQGRVLNLLSASVGCSARVRPGSGSSAHRRSCFDGGGSYSRGLSAAEDLEMNRKTMCG